MDSVVLLRSLFAQHLARFVSYENNQNLLNRGDSVKDCLRHTKDDDDDDGLRYRERRIMSDADSAC